MDPKNKTFPAQHFKKIEAKFITSHPSSIFKNIFEVSLNLKMIIHASKDNFAIFVGQLFIETFIRFYIWHFR